MLHTFKSVDDAVAAGYTRANRKHGTYRGCTIYAHDTSGGNAIHYSYAIAVLIPDQIDNYTFNYASTTFGDSVQVWTDDLNQVRQPGSFAVMFAPADLAAAIERAHAWIDAYYAENPASAARLVALEKAQAASEARHAAKMIGRQIRRSARMAAAAL